MADRTESLVLRCFIEGAAGSWKAICVDLDIAAEGESLHEVQSTLTGMIESYLETVMTYPEDERRKFLNRKAPLFVRLKLTSGFILASLFALRRGNDRLSMISHYACPA